MSESDATRLRRILAALTREIDKPAPPVALGTSDFDWLASILERIADGEDLSSMFRTTRRGKPTDDNHIVWVAVDVAQRAQELGTVKAARRGVALDWRLSTDQVKRAELQARDVATELLKKPDQGALIRLVETHRARYLVR
jgi:hypothetical protein